MYGVRDIVTTIEEEVQVGEQLLNNLSAQREAILAWNASTLLERLSEKELLLYRLQELTTRQQTLVAASPHYSSAAHQSLNALLVQLPAGPEKTMLNDLQHRAWEIYQRLRAEEQKLISLLENLLGYMQELLTSLDHTAVQVYGRSGTPAHFRSVAELIQGKV